MNCSNGSINQKKLTLYHKICFRWKLDEFSMLKQG